MSEWQPIETAPRDGTPILVGCVGRGVLIATWYERMKCFSEAITGTDLWGAKTPTHWMPLPPPPAGT